MKLDDATIIEPTPLRVVATVMGPNNKALTDFCREALHTLLFSKTYAEAQHAVDQAQQQSVALRRLDFAQFAGVESLGFSREVLTKSLRNAT